MTRLWPSTRPRRDDAPPEMPSPAPVPPRPVIEDPEAQLLDVELDDLDRYPYRPHRPLAQTGARVALWGAVAIGCLGGVVGLLRPAGGPTRAVAERPADEGTVPGTVAGFAELVVETWLTATETDQDQLAALFVDPPSLSAVNTDGLSVERVTTIAGRKVDDDYWVVTVAADVLEARPTADLTGDEAGDDGLAAPEGEEPAPVTWYVETAVVGDAEGGLAALTTPAVMSGPPHVDSPWRPSRPAMHDPDNDDEVAATVEGFLAALLTGQGDPSRYLAPRVSIPPADPPPFAEITIDQLAVEELEDGDIQIWVTARATTPGGARQVVAYDLLATQRVDRWEILELTSALSYEARPEGERSSGDADAITSTATTEEPRAPSERPPGESAGTGTATSSPDDEPFRWEPDASDPAGEGGPP